MLLESIDSSLPEGLIGRLLSYHLRIPAHIPVMARTINEPGYAPLCEIVTNALRGLRRGFVAYYAAFCGLKRDGPKDIIYAPSDNAIHVFKPRVSILSQDLSRLSVNASESCDELRANERIFISPLDTGHVAVRYCLFAPSARPVQ